MSQKYTPINKLSQFVEKEPKDATEVKKPKVQKSYAKTQRFYVKEIGLYDSEGSRHPFNVFKDKEIGMPRKYQGKIIDSVRLLLC